MIDRLKGLMWRFWGSYKVWVVHSAAPINIYEWENWRKLMPMIAALLSLSREKAHIRSFQAYEHKNGWLGFGRLPWSVESNRRWTTKYLEGPRDHGEVQFLGTEVWAPDWNSGIRKGRSADIFIKVFGDTGVEGLKNGLVIAMRMHLFKENEMLVRADLEKLLSAAPGYTLSSTVRHWKGSSWRLTNDIMDMNGQEMRQIIQADGQ